MDIEQQFLFYIKLLTNLFTDKLSTKERLDLLDELEDLVQKFEETNQ